MKAFIDIVPTFKPGDPRPEGYIAFHEWAKVQHASGRRQAMCNRCSLWNFPQELENGTCDKCRAKEAK
jgi:hypothetical protein